MNIQKLVDDAQELREELIANGLTQDEFDDALEFLETLLEKQKK